MIVMLFFVPFFSGTAICKLTGIRRNAASCYLTGTFFEWALLQVISVPMILLRCNFKIVVISVSAMLALTCLFGFYFAASELKNRKLNRHEWNISAIIAFVLLAVTYLYIAVSFYKLQHTDADDARFVVNAVDIVRTNRMFLTNPSTGAAISGFWGDMHRDAVSPWAVYFAYLSKITKVPVTIMAHTILPQTLLLCMACSYWLIADHFFNGDTFAISGLVFIALLINIYATGDGWNAECFAMVRIWQGKAVVAAVGIPTVFLSFAWIYKDSNGWKKYLFLYCVSFSLCLMSGMGIIIGGVLIGIFGLAYGIMKKKVTVALKIWIGLLISIVYYGISLMQY